MTHHICFIICMVQVIFMVTKYIKFIKVNKHELHICGIGKVVQNFDSLVGVALLITRLLSI